jgi:prevent-host-death family protein
MKKTISASDLRSQIRRVMDEVGYGRAQYVVEKFGEPTAAIVSIEDFRLLQAARERQAAGAVPEPVSDTRTGEQGPEDIQPDARLQEARAGFYAQPQLSDLAMGLGLEPEQVEQLATVAQAQQRSALEVVQAALAGWLAQETDIERARRLMRELGEGLGQGPSGQSVARDHDAYLYTREPA